MLSTEFLADMSPRSTIDRDKHTGYCLRARARLKRGSLAGDIQTFNTPYLLSVHTILGLQSRRYDKLGVQRIRNL